MKERIKSKALFEEAKKYIPGGVNSPVRAFGSVGIDPVFVERGKGSRVYDVDGNEYLDYICSWGPMIFGHSHEALMEGIEEVFKKSTSFGMPTAIEVEMAKMISEAYPAAELVRMVNSGTEATMSALRVARGYTGRTKFIKFEGCYHGHSDSLLVKTGSGALTFGVPTSPGVTEGTTKDTIVCTYNDLESVKKAFGENKGQIAAVIIEVISGNMGVVPPKKEFLEGLRALTKEEGTVLIFDEVITGFRVAYGGASEVFGLEPDMVCFGKIIGGGLPVGAYAGKREIMSCVSPVGPVYQAGTLSGNPLAMHMGLKTLQMLREDQSVYKRLEDKAKYLEDGFNAIIQELGIVATVNRAKSMVCLFLAPGPVDSYEAVMQSDTEKYGIYIKEMLEKGIMLPPAQFEALFMSDALTQEDMDYTLASAKEALKVAYKL